RSQPDLFGAQVPTNAPWDPMRTTGSGQGPVSRLTGPVAAFSREPAEATRQARHLQTSARRHIWGNLFDIRDWTSFLYLPLLFPVLVLLPYYSAKVYKQHRVTSEIIDAIAQSNSTTHKALELLQRGPVEPWAGMRFEEVGQVEPPDYRGFEFLSDS